MFSTPFCAAATLWAMPCFMDAAPARMHAILCSAICGCALDLTNNTKPACHPLFSMPVMARAALHRNRFPVLCPPERSWTNPRHGPHSSILAESTSACRASCNPKDTKRNRAVDPDDSCRQKCAVAKALAKISKLPVVKAKPVMIRVESFFLSQPCHSSFTSTNGQSRPSIFAKPSSRPGAGSRLVFFREISPTDPAEIAPSPSCHITKSLSCPLQITDGVVPTDVLAAICREPMILSSR